MECVSSPSPEQIALALAIVKLKPVGVDIKDYILQGRKLIKTSKTAEVFHSPDKFFDSVSFWRQAYERSEAEQSKLLDRIFELEEQNEVLTAKFHAREEIPTKSAVKLPLKRKGTNKQPTDKQPKKQRHSMKHSLAAEVDAFDNGLTTRSDDSGSTGPFVRQFYLLQKALQKRNTASVIRTAVALCKSCENELVSVVPQETPRDRSKNQTLAQTKSSHFCLSLRTIESAITLLILALTKLPNIGDLRQEEALLIYHIVCLYEAAINTLKRYCKTIPTPDATARTEYPIQTRAKTSNRTKVSAADEGALMLTSLLGRIIASLDLTCPRHQRLLEGLLYVLLSRAGKVLCVFVFQDLELQPDLRADLHKLPLPAGLIDAEFDGKSLGGTETEAKYLIWLLKRTLAAVDTFPALRSSVSPGNPSGQVQSSIRARLQNTLFQAVFGEGLKSEQSLQRPEPPGNFELERSLPDNQITDSPIPEWYIQQVWELLGCDDILIKNNYSCTGSI